MKMVRIFALPTLFLLACGSSQDRGLEGEGTVSAAEAPDSNPEGVPYPAGPFGINARRGTAPGSVIENYKFIGYPDGNPANGLQPISLASFFDPTGTRVRLIHVQASGTWCTYCRQETKVVTTLAEKLASRKVVWVMSLAEGASFGLPSTQSDLDKWISQYRAPYPHLLDSGNKNFGPFYDANALPWNANIDARTMEILSSGTGAKTTEDDILGELDEWLRQLTTVN